MRPLLRIFVVVLLASYQSQARGDVGVPFGEYILEAPPTGGIHRRRKDFSLVRVHRTGDPIGEITKNTI